MTCQINHQVKYRKTVYKANNCVIKAIQLNIHISKESGNRGDISTALINHRLKFFSPVNPRNFFLQKYPTLVRVCGEKKSEPKSALSAHKDTAI